MTNPNLDQEAYSDIDECAGGCEFHAAGLRAVVALFAHLDTLEQRIEALESDRARHRRSQQRPDWLHVPGVGR
jgi:hypothetical protein